MFHNFFEVSSNSYSIAAIFGEVMGHSSQRKIIGLDQSFLKEPSLFMIHLANKHDE